MSRKTSGSALELLQLCAAYFGSYVATGVLVKYFTVLRAPKMGEFTYLFNNTLGGCLLALGVVIALGWTRHLQSIRAARLGPLTVPAEIAYIIPSGVCTAIVIPTTTLLYSLPISVMVAMVIMRGGVIVICRLVDALQIRQGILRRRVYAEENLAAVFALLAIAAQLLLLPVAAWLEGRGVRVLPVLGLSARDLTGGFAFVRSGAAVTILGFYLVAYAARIYIMNFYKNTRPAGEQLDNRGFFAVEQIAASVAMVAFTLIALTAAALHPANASLGEFARAVHRPGLTAILSGLPYGAVAFFSVFILMFPGRTATFAGLANRLTSLLAGIAATLLTAWWFHTRWPSVADWMTVALIMVAVGFLRRAEQRRTVELAAA